MVNLLAQLHMPIPDDVDKRFRKKVMQKYGLKKGNLQKAIIEALDQWDQTPPTSKGIIRDVGNAKRPLVYVPEEYAGKKVRIIPLE